jgi:tight adherence protein B
MIPFFVFLFCLFGTYATYLIATRKTAEQRARVQKRLSDILVYSADTEDAQVQLARMEMLSEMPFLNQFLLEMPIAKKLRLYIDQADLHLTVMRLFLFSALAGMLAAMTISFVTYLLPIIILTGVVAATVPFIHLMWKRKKRLDRFLADLPDALELMSRALSAGHAFSATLSMIAHEMADPIAMEFRRTYEEHNLGLSSKLALENLAMRVPLLDLRIVITAIQIQRETGGNLAEILEKVAQTIRDRFKIMEDLNTLTTQSRMSAYLLCAMPLFIGVVMTIINTDYMSVLWRDPRGHQMIGVAAAMQLVGILIVKKIMQIKI